MSEQITGTAYVVTFTSGTSAITDQSGLNLLNIPSTNSPGLSYINTYDANGFFLSTVYVTLFGIASIAPIAIDA